MFTLEKPHSYGVLWIYPMFIVSRGPYINVCDSKIYYLKEIVISLAFQILTWKGTQCLKCYYFKLKHNKGTFKQI